MPLRRIYDRSCACVDAIDALNLDDHQVLDDQIDPVSKLNFLSLENYRQPDLACHFKAMLSEVMGEAALVDTFEQPRPENRMDMHCRRNNRAGNLIDTQGVRRERSSSHSKLISRRPGFTLCPPVSSVLKILGLVPK